jgi:hypothetical protein
MFLEYYKDYTVSKLHEILISNKLQENMLNKLLKSHKIFKNFADQITFKIVDYESNFKEEIDDKTIKEISERYHHLKPISKEEFINSILKDIKNIKKSDESLPLLLNQKKILNVTKLINNNINIKNDFSFFNFNNFSKVEDSNNIQNELINYRIIKDNIITNTYSNILQFLNNPTFVLNVKNTPKSVLNLFDVLTKEILNKEVLNKENINTLNYYKILKEKLPRFECLSHLTILFIIFQIIIPYYYDVYREEIFEDYLLY